MLLDLAHSNTRIYVIEISAVTDRYGVLLDEYGRFDKRAGRYMDQDILHLGFKGLRVFATCIKNAVINYKKRNFRSIHSNQVNNRYQGQDRSTALKNSSRGESLPPHSTR